MIAVTFALRSESAGLRRLLQGGDQRTTVLHTGVGAKICRDRIEKFLDAGSYRFLISSGFAGGVDPSLGVGDLLVAENYSDPRLLAEAREFLFARVGKLATVDRVIETTTEREKFAREEGALAVDMETKWIAEACARRQLPMLSLRAISDTAAAPFPAPPAVLFNQTRQKTEPLALASYLARHPGGIMRLARFARQVASARRSLTSALAILVREV